MAVCVKLIRRPQPDQLVDCVTQLDLDIITLAGHPDIRFSELTKKKQRMSRLLTQGKTKGAVLAALFDSFVHIAGKPVKSVCRTGAVNALMGPLMIVVGNPVAESLTGIGKGNKQGIREKFLPDRPPESFDLAERHWMLR